MADVVKGLAVLGSTGSIGTQTLDVVRSFPDEFDVVALAARTSLEMLEAQVKEFHPRLISCEATYEQRASLLSNGCNFVAMEDMVQDPEVDLVVTATVGDVALLPTIKAIENGKTVALANKESVVMAGELLTKMTRVHKVELLPLDSEPSAIWQCLRGEEKSIEKLIITASGGAFRDMDPAQLGTVTPQQALKHPTWQMGPKITVDSATLMNKAFEVIEAHWLFDVPWEDIEVVIHPESIIHSMVEFVDGSTKAHLSPPDMHLPIQYALFYPERVHNESISRFDPIATESLTFRQLDPSRYPCFGLALNFAMRGGTWPAALCGADEMAVDLFLSGKIGFTEIPELIRDVLEGHDPLLDPSADDLLRTTVWAKDRALNLVEG